MKKLMVMAMVLGAAVIFMAGCGKKEEPAAGALDSLKKSTEAVATDAKAAAADAKVAGDKAAADAKAAADKAAADAKK